MKNKKEHLRLVEAVRQQVMKEFTRIPGEDYEEWCEFVRYEVDSRLKEIEEQRIKSLSIVIER